MKIPPDLLLVNKVMLDTREPGKGAGSELRLHRRCRTLCIRACHPEVQSIEDLRKVGKNALELMRIIHHIPETSEAAPAKALRDDIVSNSPIRVSRSSTRRHGTCEQQARPGHDHQRNSCKFRNHARNQCGSAGPGLSIWASSVQVSPHLAYGSVISINTVWNAVAPFLCFESVSSPMGQCKVCEKSSSSISKELGVCISCIRVLPEKALPLR